MPLILNRNQVLDVFAEAATNKWVVPAFGTENLTTTEAILAATLDYSRKVNKPDIPVMIAITSQYSHRQQSANYTHTRRWDIGLKLFQADLEVLTSKESPFGKLRVMTLLDHAQWDSDEELFKWDMRKFSMIMYDASTLPFEANIEHTNKFVEKNKDIIVIEGACDEIVDATGNQASQLTTPESAIKYLEKTGVDFIVANLGTEHRASHVDLKYHSELAREVSENTGTRLVLHGTSSVGQDQIRHLFHDGIAKVNIWTTLERDSSPALLEDMVKNASRIMGRDLTSEFIDSGILGKNIAQANDPSIDYYTTVYRQNIIFKKMKEIVSGYLNLWYK